MQADVLLVTATKVETKAVLDEFRGVGQQTEPQSIQGRVYFNLGTVNGARVMLTQAEMGPGGLGASQQAVEKGIATLAPAAVIMVGIAFGVSEENQSIGDVLIAERLRLYELQKVSTAEGGELTILLRDDKPHASPWLLNLFRSSEVTWEGAELRFGTILTGAKLIDNIDFREQLRVFEPEAIGGEMEGAGLYVSCQDRKVDWLLVKSICDFADGNKSREKKERQALAARNAAAFVFHALHFVKVDWHFHAPSPRSSSAQNGPTDSSLGAESTGSPPLDSLIVSESGDLAFLHNFFFTAQEVEETGSTVRLVLASGDAEDDAAMRSLGARRSGDRLVGFAWGNEGGMAEVKSTTSRQFRGKLVWTVLLERRHSEPSVFGEMSYNDGTRTYSAQDLATLRARRILLAEESPDSSTVGPSASNAMLEVMLRGVNAPVQIARPVLPTLYNTMKGQPPAVFLRAARLYAIYLLRSSGVVEHVQRLALGPLREGQMRVSFRGQRHRFYANQEPAIIELNGVCRLEKP